MEVCHHPVFAQFTRFRGNVPEGFQISDFLGARTRASFVAKLLASQGHVPRHYDWVDSSYPAFNDDYFLWVDVLEAVVWAEERLTVVELGTGYGEWLVRVFLAARQRRPGLPVKLIGVEAEPTHFDWMRTHLADNGINPDEHELIEAAVDEKEGTVDFYVGDPDGWYGQAIARPESLMGGVSLKSVTAVTLATILRGIDSVDLIHLDCQGAELLVLRSAIGELSSKVKRVHVNTHSLEIERGLRELFWAADWHKANDYSTSALQLTPWGEMQFPDGVQTWINPRLSAVHPTLEQQQSMLRCADARLFASETEAERLRATVAAAG